MKRRFIVKQHDVEDCAAACVKSVAAYYGVEKPLIEIREACGTDKNGTSVLGILKAAEWLKLDAKAMKSPEKKIGSLISTTLPATLHICQKDGALHFVVLYSINGNKCTIMDPAIGDYKKLSINELEDIWSGIVIFFTPSATFQKSQGNESAIMRLFKVLLLCKAEYKRLILYSFLFVIAGISTSIFVGEVIDRILPSKESEMLIVVIIIMLIITLISSRIIYLRGMTIIKSNIKIDMEIIMKFISHLFKLPISFFMTRSSGELNSRISDIAKVRSFITDASISLIVASISVIISMVAMLGFHWKIASIVMIFVPIYSMIYIITNRINRRYNREIIVKSANFEAKSVEAISSVKSIKYFGIESLFEGVIRRNYCELANTIYSAGKRISVIGGVINTTSNLLIISVLSFGAYYIFTGSITVGEFVTFYSLASFISSPITELITINDSFTEAKIATERVFEIIDLPTECDSFEKGSKKLPSPPAKFRSIEFRDVTFSYVGRDELFKNLNLTINSGEICAVIGESGCGKSTFAELLMRSYNTDSGEISIDGISIKSFNIEDWRRYISIVPQRATLFKCSIIDNITCCDLSPDYQSVVSICRELGILNFTSELPLGLMTEVGESGATLSGGQIQRIAIARALYRDPSILILDEATSSLDSESELLIFNTLQRLKRENKAVILITHNNNNLKYSDKIIKMSAHSSVEIYTPENVV